MTKEEAYNKVEKTIEEYFEFVDLVRRMREAFMKAEDPEYDREFWEIRAINLEEEVDEWLEKMK